MRLSEMERVTGDVQLEIAKRIQLLPPIIPNTLLQPLDLTPILVPDVLSSVALDERLDPFIVQIPTLVKQLSLFGLKPTTERRPPRPSSTTLARSPA